MASVVTWAGTRPEDLQREIARMPSVVDAYLRIGARSIADGIRGDTSDVYRSRGWKLADEVFVTETEGARTFVVSVKPGNPRPANLPLWWEFGTRKLLARPAFGPALARARVRYPVVMDQQLQRAFDATVNK